MCECVWVPSVRAWARGFPFGAEREGGAAARTESGSRLALSPPASALETGAPIRLGGVRNR